MTGKRTWVLFGLVGAVAGLAWAVKSGRLGGGGASPTPIMMTPAVAVPDDVTAPAIRVTSDRVTTNAVASGSRPVAPRPEATETRSTQSPATSTAARSASVGRSDPVRRSTVAAPVAPTTDAPVGAARADGLRTIPRGDGVARRSGDQVLELVRAGRLADAREALKGLPSDESAAQLVRVVTDLERDLLEVGSLHRAGDWYQLEQALERLDRPGRVVPRPELPVVAEARAWSEAQRRLRVSQKEWRLALEEALRWENRSRIQSLLDVREYPDDPIRVRARERLATLERSEKRLAEVRGLLRDGRLVEVERLLSTAEFQGRMELKELRDELTRRKGEQEALTRRLVSEIDASGRRMRRADFEEFVRQIPTAQQADGSVKQAIVRARQQVEAREVALAAAAAAAARSAATAPAVRPVVPPPASPTVLPAAARAPESARVATNAVPAPDPDEATFQFYKKQLGGTSGGSIPKDSKAKVREFLSRYSQRHPEREKEILVLLDKLRNF